MTLDEAIEHARNVAEENREHLNWNITSTWKENCRQCAEEHEQLAKWLEELKARREDKWVGSTFLEQVNNSDIT